MSNVKYAKTPWWYLVLTCLPLFVMSAILPAHALTEPWLAVDKFVDSYLFGVVGFWSSSFPFVAKVINNYISLFGPIFGVVLFFWKFRELPENSELYKSISILKYAFAMLVIVGFYVFFFWMFYFSFEDMAVKRKMRIFAMDEFVFAAYSSFMMMLYYLFFFMAHAVFIRVPRYLFKRHFGCNLDD